MHSAKKINLPTGFFFIDAADSSQAALLQPLLKEKETLEVYTHWSRLPFLSLKDNLFLGKANDNLPNYLFDVQLDQTILEKNTAELTALEEIQLQLLSALLQRKKILVLNESIQELSVAEVQRLLPLCHRLCKKYLLTIYLISGDKKLAQVNFVSLTKANDLKKAYYFND